MNLKCKIFGHIDEDGRPWPMLISGQYRLGCIRCGKVVTSPNYTPPITRPKRPYLSKEEKEAALRRLVHQRHLDEDDEIPL